MSGWKPAFAGYPGTAIKEFTTDKNGKTKTRSIKHLLWGDWMLVGKKKQGGLVEAYSRGKVGFVDPGAVTEERVLEVVFVDIGQGDGCLLVTPDDRHLIIDAGEHDNMYRFLNWRYGKFKKPFEFEALMVSHPDQDHYKGFAEFFDPEPDNVGNIRFKHVYHNGIVERKAKNSLGRRVKVNGKSHVKDLVQDTAQLQQFLSVASRWKGKRYPTMLNDMLASGRVGDFRSLSVEDGFVPGFEGGKELSLQILGPVLARDGSGDPCLPWLSSVGKTKNGHSVVLKLKYKNVTMMLGGDLNIPAEHLLLSHHTGLKSPPRGSDAHRTLVRAARQTFQVDVAKACHHGSADFTSIFLEALNPIATVISSGDDESHAHPRAETLGTVGLFSRGARPLIFSTELARSAKERIKHPSVVRQQFRAANEALSKIKADPNAKPSQVAKAQKAFDKLVDAIERSVAVYGAINVRTDGEKVLFAQKIEKGSGKWDTYRLEPQGAAGVLEYVAKHH